MDALEICLIVLIPATLLNSLPLLWTSTYMKLSLPAFIFDASHFVKFLSTAPVSSHSCKNVNYLHSFLMPATWLNSLHSCDLSLLQKTSITCIHFWCRPLCWTPSTPAGGKAPPGTLPRWWERRRAGRRGHRSWRPSWVNLRPDWRCKAKPEVERSSQSQDDIALIANWLSSSLCSVQYH